MKNSANGSESLFIASLAFEVEGRDKDAGEALLAEWIAFCTRPVFAYLHMWRVGDVLLWDRRAILHRGRPWPYDQPRSLVSAFY